MTDDKDKTDTPTEPTKKRGRGRPRKGEVVVKKEKSGRGRGRPRKPETERRRAEKMGKEISFAENYAPPGCKSQKELREEVQEFADKNDGGCGVDSEQVKERFEKEEELKRDILDKLACDLLLQERDFVELYLNGMSPLEAYRLSGLKVVDMGLREWSISKQKFMPDRRANYYLRKPAVKLYLNVIMRTGIDRCAMTVEMADNKLTDMINSDVVDVFDKSEEFVDKDGVVQRRGRLKELSSLTAGQRGSITGIKYTANGGFEVKMIDKLKAIDMLYKRRGAYVGGGFGGGEKVDVNVGSGGNVQMVVAMAGDNGRGPGGDGVGAGSGVAVGEIGDGGDGEGVIDV